MSKVNLEKLTAIGSLNYIVGIIDASETHYTVANYMPRKLQVVEHKISKTDMADCVAETIERMKTAIFLLEAWQQDNTVTFSYWAAANEKEVCPNWDK